MEKLIPLSVITEPDEMDSVASAKPMGKQRAFDLLLEAQFHWDNMRKFRKDRERNKRYTYGDQWKDLVTVNGETMTEEEYIKEQGNIPLKNNLIRRLTRNVQGIFRGQDKEATCIARDRDEQKLGETMSTVLQCNMQLNRMDELYARTMEEFLISGFIVHKKWYGWRNSKTDCWTDYIQPNNFFIDANMRDFRGWDCTIVGEIHDVSFRQLCAEFANGPEDYKKLSDIYSLAGNKNTFLTHCSDFGYSNLENIDFLFTADPTRCRVIEIWKKEIKPRYRCHDLQNGEIFKIEVDDYESMVVAVNEERRKLGLQSGMKDSEIPYIKAEWFMDDFWYFYYLTPFGDILQEGETPYEHGGHPYIFKAYPFIDGEIHSFVADVIDQQRYTNRLITMYDFIMRASAKGALLMPEECIPAGTSIEEIAEEWARFDGIILYRAKTGVPVPTQVSSNSTNIGIHELLNLQLKFFEDISGVNGALQGKPGYSQMSGSLYAQQTQNATTSLLDLMESFSSFVVDAAYMDVKNIQQFYDEKRFFNIAGKNAIVEYDPAKISDVEFDLSIVESMSSPVFRQMANDLIMKIYDKGDITLEQMLQVGDFPFADALLQNINAQKEQMQQGQIPDSLSPELMQQVQNGANMEAVNQMYNAVRADA